MAKNDDSVVQPLESVAEAPAKKGEICLNCKNQDPKTKNTLNSKGVCDVCGFQKDLLYNGPIEADKRAIKIELARQADQQ